MEEMLRLGARLGAALDRIARAGEALAADHAAGGEASARLASEVERMRAERAAEIAELDAIRAEIAPLIAQEEADARG
jgi:hypothetical protein